MSHDMRRGQKGLREVGVALSGHIGSVENIGRDVAGTSSIQPA